MHSNHPSVRPTPIRAALHRAPRTRNAAFSIALLAGALLPQLANAQQIGVQVGATPAVRVVPNAKFTVPISVDLTLAGGANLAALQGTLTWDVTRMTFDSLRLASQPSWSLSANTALAASGSVSFDASSATALAASGTLMNAYFTGAGAAGGTRVILTPTTAANSLGASVLTVLRPQSLDVCVGPSGKGGDVSNDNNVNIIDAQQIARYSVLLPVANVAAVVARGDVNNSGSVNIIDAQQVARFSVGLPLINAPLARVNVDAFMPPTVASILLNPGSAQNLTIGSALSVTSTPRDAGNADVSGCADVTWASSNPAFATVNASGLVAGLSGGTTTVTATSVNNPAVSASVSVTVGGAAPDLIVTAMTAPASATVGTSVAMSATAKNQGTLGTSSFTLGFYFSTDATITTADVFSGARCTFSLGPNVSTTCAGNIPVPNSLPPGTYYVGAIVDDQGVVAETDESNNGLAASTTTAILAATPDLLVDVVTAPATGTIGSTIAASATVHNQGASTAQSFRVSFYFSTDATITAGDVYSGFSCTLVTGLASNTTSSCAGSIPVPAGLTPGTYYLGTLVDDLSQVSEANENNNATAATSTTVLLASTPDLIVTALTVASTGTVGGTIAGSATIRNQGATTAQSFRVGFYFSTDASITTGDVYSTFSCTLATGLASNSTSICAGAVPVPAGLAPGTYYVGAIVDDQAQVTEASESNNSLAAASTTVVLAATPDLIVSVMTAPTAATIGGTIAVLATVRNQGTSTVQSFRVGLYYSSDALITTGDIFSGFSCTFAAGLASNTSADCTGTMPVPSNLPPGAYFVGAVADDQSQLAEASESNNSLAASAITTASVAGTLNLTIDGVYITQATQTYTGTVPLVAGRAAYLRVFVKASTANSVAPNVRVRFYQNGALTATSTIPAGVAAVPTTITEGVLASSWNLPIAGNVIQPGLSMLVDVDPTGSVAEADKGDNTFPTSGTPQLQNVQTAPSFDVRFVPIVHTVSGLTGSVNSGTAASFMTDALRLWPLQAFTTNVRASFTTAAASLTQGSAWNQILSEIDALRVADGSSSYYYGVLPPEPGAVYCGLGFIPGRAAIGTDSCGSATAAHEWGHNFSRQHAPCGNPGNPDPAYPYAGASIGAYGFDVANVALKAPASFLDLMSYCSPLWVSDYNYSAVMSFRSAQGFSPANVVGAVGPTVLVWGRISNGSLVLEPAFDVVTRASLPRASGPLSVEGFDSRGNRLFNLSFAGTEIADAPNGDRSFAFAVPVTWSSTAGLASVRARAADGAIASATSNMVVVASGATRIPRDSGGVTARITGPAVRVAWDARAFPMAIIRDAATGEILAFARGGTSVLRSQARDLDVSFSDGVRSFVRRVRVTQ